MIDSSHKPIENFPKYS